MTEEEKKSNITLNINKNLLDKIDKLIEENGGMRSTLIEELLKNYIDSNKKNTTSF